MTNERLPHEHLFIAFIAAAVGNARFCRVAGGDSRWRVGSHGEQIAAARWNLGAGPVFGEVPHPRQAVRGTLTEGPAAASASLGARRLPGHLDPVAVRVQAFERYVG